MQHLHNRLREKYSWYANWHNGPLHAVVHWGGLLLVMAFFAMVITGTVPIPSGLQGLSGRASGFPGGFLESYDSTNARPQYTAAQISQFVPAAKGAFTFPAPYNTQAIRLTDPSDCSAEIPNCIDYVGYSYWRNMNNHVGSDIMYIILGKTVKVEGYNTSTVNLYALNKDNNQVTDLGNAFTGSSLPQYGSSEGLYFSANMPTKLYTSGNTVSSKLYRYDVLSKQVQTVFDVATQPGWADKYIFQYHSSDDDRVHSATLKQQGTYASIGCVVYREDNQQFLFYPKRLGFDECQIDRGGRYLVIKDKHYATTNEQDAIIVDIVTGREVVLRDQEGAPGHSDNGYGYVVGDDNYSGYCGSDFCNPSPNAPVTKMWNFSKLFSSDPTIALEAKKGLVVEQGRWNAGSATSHITHTNAQANEPINDQFACKSGTGGSGNRANELFCFKNDGSQTNLIVAPMMTNLPAGSDSLYLRAPKGNLDVTGTYFIWTSNMGVDSNHLDAFIVKVPSQRLTGGETPAPDTTPPVTAITAPTNGALVGGTVQMSATATDNVGVSKVDFYVDEALVGSDTSSPYTVNFDTTAVANGSHTLKSKATDSIGNVGSSMLVSITVNNSAEPPVTTARINVAPATLAFTGISGGATPAAKTVTISNTGAAFASVNIATDKDWCSITSSVMNLPPGQGYTAQVSVDAPSNPGVYYCSVIMSANNADNSPLSLPITYTVTGTTTIDTAPPQVSMTAPATGTVVIRKSLVTMLATATDNTAVSKVEFYVNGSRVCTSTSSPYSCTWRVPLHSRRTSYTLEARAYDAAGNIGKSNQVIITTP